jgi:hypothetical protein
MKLRWQACWIFLVFTSIFANAAQRPRWSLHSFPLSNGASQTVVADVNGDGKPDLIQLTGDSLTIQVLLGNGNGTFQAAKFTTLPTFVHQFAVIDVNRDGKLDLVALGDNQFTVLLGNGDGTFQAGKVTIVNVFTTTMVVGDLNNDGFPDVIAGNEVFLGDGKGNFNLNGTLFSWNFEEAIVDSYAFRDFNNDGHNDVVVLDGFLQNEIRSFRNTGNGTFVLMQTIQFPILPQGLGPIYVADLNNDGKLDILVHVLSACPTGTCPAAIMIALGNGDGTFQTPQVFNTAGLAGLGDVNGDKKLDLIIATHNSTTGTYEIDTYLNNGTGQFTSPKVNTTLQCNDFLAADLDGDRLSDLLCDTPTGTEVALSKGDGTYIAGATTVNNPSTILALTDITRDGAKDAILEANDGSKIYTLANLSGTNVTPSTSPSSLLYRQPFVLSAAVAPSLTPNVSTAPGGTITFKDGSAVLGSAAVGANFADSGGMNVGTHTLTASYGGDNFFNPRAVTFTRTVAKAGSHTSLTSSLNPSPRGHAVTFTAKVSPQFAGTPGGKVTFKNGTTVLATVTLSSGKATFTTSTLPVGSHSITATFTGDGNFNSSASPVLTQKVN